MDQGRPRSFVIIAWLMIAFGCAEIITSFTHNFFGLHTVQGPVSTYFGASIGALYGTAGCLVLTMKRQAAILAVALLILVVVGRISMVATGLYPVATLRQAAAIIAGTSIAVGFAVYIALRTSASR